MEAVKGCCLLVLAGLCILFATGCERVASDGFDPASATYSPTPPRPVETVEHLTEPIVYTIDARSENVWVYFDFSRGAVVPVLDSKEDAWDLAFKRYVMKTNGGRSNPDGQGAVLKLRRRDFVALSKVPGDVEFQADVHPKNRLHPFNPVLEKWVQLQLPGQRAGPQAGGLRHPHTGRQVRQNADAELLLHRQRGGLHDV